MNSQVISKKSANNVYLSSFGKSNMMSRNDSAQIKSSTQRVIDSVQTDFESDQTNSTHHESSDNESATSYLKRG